jgi:cell division protein FtsI (penicillin-binding protein 3)
MQGAAEAALADAVKKHNAVGGLVLTLDPKNGDILSLAESPGFDPNRFRELDYEETRARSFTDLVEAGSTMKAFLIASALDSGELSARQEFDTGDGSIYVRGKTIHDHEPYGILRPDGILRVSSNVGAILISQLMGREAQYDGLLRFGFNGSTKSGYPMESPGLLRDWSKWQPVDQATIAFGQGVSVTAIQLASALGALANEGVRMRPRIVHARRRTGGAWHKTAIQSQGRAVSRAAARQTLDMMRTVVSPEGTGRLAALAGVAVAGKTGTAQKLDTRLGRYSRSRYIAWFMGVVPADDPELVIVVAIDEPGGYPHSGGYVAAPVFARVASAQLARRGIVTEPAPLDKPKPKPTLLVENAVSEPRERPRPSRAIPKKQSEPIWHDEPPLAAVAAPPARPVAVVETTTAGPLPSFLEDPVFVPDFSGQTMARARYVAASESLKIMTRGAIEGRVVSQRPVPGTILAGDKRTVRLRFSMLQEEG